MPVSAQPPNLPHETAVIPEKLPDDDAPQPTLAHIVHLGAYGLRIIVRDPRSTARIIEPGHARRRFPVALVMLIANSCASELPPISVLSLPSLRGTARRLEESRVDVGNSAVGAGKKRDSHEQFVGWRSAGLKCSHARVDVELRRRIVRGGVKGRVEVGDRPARVGVGSHDVYEI